MITLAYTRSDIVLGGFIGLSVALEVVTAVTQSVQALEATALGVALYERAQHCLFDPSYWVTSVMTMMTSLYVMVGFEDFNERCPEERGDNGQGWKTPGSRCSSIILIV